MSFYLPLRVWRTCPDDESHLNVYIISPATCISCSVTCFRNAPKYGITDDVTCSHSEASNSSTVTTDSHSHCHPYEVSSENYEDILNTVTSSGSPRLEVMDAGTIAVKKENIDGVYGEIQDNSVAGWVLFLQLWQVYVLPTVAGLCSSGVFILIVSELLLSPFDSECVDNSFLQNGIVRSKGVCAKWPRHSLQCLGKKGPSLNKRNHLL